MTDEQTSTSHGESEHGSSASADGQDGKGPRRRRRRRRSGSGSKGQGGQQDRRPSRPDPDELEEPGPRRRRERVKPEVPPEHWDEIFENRLFSDLGLRNSVVKGTEAAGFTNPTKIQAEMIPAVLAGRDVLGQSRTGSGKTAAFGLPLFHMAQRSLPFQSLILAPTRELAIQIADDLAEVGRFTPIRVSAVYGGQRIHQQAKQLDEGPEIIVATPGRLMDMVNRGHVHLNNIRFAVLDEVDRMLDIGFREDIRKILSSIKTEHQTVFVSATISEEIEKLARKFMKDPIRLEAAGASLTVGMVKQHYLSVEPWDKKQLLLHLLTHEEPDLTIVFCRTKRTVDNLAKYLRGKGIDAHAIHGDMYQGKRNSVMQRLRSGELGVLVASDLAARGLDVEGISHVVNYDLPEDPEVYIHRIGRTARAGRGGVAWAFVASDQGGLLTEIEKLANIHIPQLHYPDFRPGPVPDDVAQEKSRESKRLEDKRAAGNRYSSTSEGGDVAIEQPDPSKFPGGIVPAKMPPKMMRGRVRTGRSR